MRVCPCSVRCKDQHALNSLLENEFLGSAVVVNDALVNGKLFVDGSTPKFEHSTASSAVAKRPRHVTLPPRLTRA